MHRIPFTSKTAPDDNVDRMDYGVYGHTVYKYQIKKNSVVGAQNSIFCLNLRRKARELCTRISSLSDSCFRTTSSLSIMGTLV